HHPVGEVAVFGDFQAAENGKVDMAAADHREGVGAGEEAAARQAGDGLLAGVDKIGIDRVRHRKGADAEQAVFRLQRDVHAIGNVVSNQGRNADAEIDVVA